LSTLTAIAAAVACDGAATPGAGPAPAPVSDPAEAAEAAEAARRIGTCGALADTADPQGVLFPIDDHATAVPAIQVLDPMGEATQAFEREMAAAGLDARMHRVGVLFPLDYECNWMLHQQVHAGACALARAVLCAHDGKGSTTTPAVLQWVAAEHASLRAANDARTVERRLGERFPDLVACVDSPDAKARLNRSLRWAIGRGLATTVPQLYVRGTRVCFEEPGVGIAAVVRAVLDRDVGGGA